MVEVKQTAGKLGGGEEEERRREENEAVSGSGDRAFPAKPGSNLAAVGKGG